MKKNEFLSRLEEQLAGLPKDDLQERLSFYAEMIDDRMEEGLSQEEAVAEIGSVEEVAERIISETPLSKLVKEKMKPKRTLKAWEIVLLILGSPIWLSLLIAALSVVLSLYLVWWSLIVSLWAILPALVVGALGGVIISIACFIGGDALMGFSLFGAALVCAGLSIFLFFGAKAATVGSVKLTKKFFLWLKNRFIKKEETP